MDLLFIEMAMAIGLSANGAFIAMMLFPVVIGGLAVLHLKLDELLAIQRFAAKKGVELTLAECRRRKILVERNYRPTFGELVIERIRQQSRR